MIVDVQGKEAKVSQKVAFAGGMKGGFRVLRRTYY